MIIEEIMGSIDVLANYLINDSERFYKTTNTYLHIFRNAVNSGGYEKYLQAVYAAAKQAYLNTKVYTEFPITANSKKASGYCDIAYMSGPCYCVEELKCYTNTMKINYFINQYIKDIIKLAGVEDYNSVVFSVGYAVGFMSFCSDNYSKDDVIQNCNDVIKAVRSCVSTPYIGVMECTKVYEVDGLYLCAVITRAYSKNPFIL